MLLHPKELLLPSPVQNYEILEREKSRCRLLVIDFAFETAAI